MALGYNMVQQIQELIFGAYLKPHHGNPSWVALHNPTTGCDSQPGVRLRREIRRRRIERLPAAIVVFICSYLFYVFGMNLAQIIWRHFNVPCHDWFTYGFSTKWTLKLSVHIFPSAEAYFPCPKQSDRDRTTRTGTLNETSQTSVEFRGGQPIDGSK